MIYYTYVSVPHRTYDEFRDGIMDNGYEVDAVAGCQCVDIAKLLNWNFGWTSPYWSTGGTGYAYGGWTVQAAREFNTGTECTLVNNLADVKRGDLIVLDASPLNEAGHVTLADEDYDGSGYLWCVGQNQGGTPLPIGGTVVTRNHLGMDRFLGGFRYNTWQQPVPPHPTIQRKKFPWVLYARKLRERNMV